MMNKEPYRKVIVVLSVMIPVLVAILFRVKIEGYDFRFLPGIYASINALTALLLTVAYVFVRRGYQKTHEVIMMSCIGLSAAFLLLYVLYHMTTPSTAYGGAGLMKYLYYFVLISHILLSFTVMPFVLFTFSRALGGNFERHKKLAKFTFPLWLYVTVSGVVVYWMINPYYQ